MISLRVTRDAITPDLRRKYAALSDKRPVHEAMALQIVSITQRSFREAGLRAAAWPGRKKPAPHQLLLKKGTLRASIRVVSVTQTEGTVGSDRVYAPVHQLGSTKNNIPARPFFPVLNGKFTPTARLKIAAVAKAKIDKLLSR